MNVGHSNGRTPAKHAYLSRVAGQDVGAAKYCASKIWPPTPYRSHNLVDLTAGDGVPRHEGAWWQTCSPGILAYHGQHKDCPVPVRISLQERHAATFDQLMVSLEKHLPEIGYVQVAERRWQARDGRVSLTAQYMDSRAMPCPWVRGDFVLLNNDPNNMHGWALPEDLGQAVDRGAIIRSFSTMGANAEGIKRLPLQGAREGWYGHVQNVTGNLRPTQDASLIAIDRDASQWAYLVVTPNKWVRDDIRDAEKVFAKSSMAVTSASFRMKPNRYRALLDRLFLTSADRRPDVPLWGEE